MVGSEDGLWSGARTGYGRGDDGPWNEPLRFFFFFAAFSQSVLSSSSSDAKQQQQVAIMRARSPSPADSRPMSAAAPIRAATTPVCWARRRASPPAPHPGRSTLGARQTARLWASMRPTAAAAATTCREWAVRRRAARWAGGRRRQGRSTGGPPSPAGGSDWQRTNASCRRWVSSGSGSSRRNCLSRPATSRGWASGSRPAPSSTRSCERGDGRQRYRAQGSTEHRALEHTTAWQTNSTEWTDVGPSGVEDPP